RRAVPGFDADEGCTGFRPEREIGKAVEGEAKGRPALGTIGEAGARTIGEDHRIVFELSVIEGQPSGSERRGHEARPAQPALEPREARLVASVQLHEMLA